MKLDKIKIFAIELILLIILAITLYVSKSSGRIILACLLAVLTIVTSLLLKKRNTQSVNSGRANVVLAIFAVIYLIGFYLMGLYFNYYRPIITFSYKTVINYIIPITIIIISSEMLRSILLAQHGKLTKIMTFIIMVIIDIMIYTNIHYVDGYDEIIELVGFTLFASVACNALYNYISVRYGLMGNIIYRLITILYAYIIPIIPNVLVFFRSILRMIYPYIIYLVLEYTFATEKKAVAFESKRKSLIVKLILGVVILIMVALISCHFTYGILVIGSGSMAGTINVGDAILYEQYNGEKPIKEGDIIIFMYKEVQVVHRVMEIKVVNGEVRYITKGDANQHQDEGYRTEADIYGTTKFRIPYMGYPTVWLRDILS